MTEELSDDFYEAFDYALVKQLNEVERLLRSLADYKQPSWNDFHDMFCMWDGIT